MDIDIFFLFFLFFFTGAKKNTGKGQSPSLGARRRPAQQAVHSRFYKRLDRLLNKHIISVGLYQQPNWAILSIVAVEHNQNNCFWEQVKEPIKFPICNKNRGVQAMAWKNIWTYFELSIAIRSYLEPFGGIWSHLEPFLASWSFLDPSGVNWSYWEPFKAISSHLKQFGGVLSHLDPFGNI